MAIWRLLSRTASLETPWIQLVGERWDDGNGHILDYWRTVNADSVIIIPEQAGELLLPQKTFRPGVGCETLDFPGGRVKPCISLEEAAYEILERELGIMRHGVVSLEALNSKALLVNSSTSSHKLYGLHARLADDAIELLSHSRYRFNSQGMANLLGELDCLQCRCLLLDLLRLRKL